MPSSRVAAGLGEAQGSVDYLCEPWEMLEGSQNGLTRYDGTESQL